jgi:type II secretory pathway pseudopilin PulG
LFLLHPKASRQKIELVLKRSTGWGQPAFTIVEVVVAFSILMVLMSLVLFGYRTLMPKVAQAKCLSNLRSLHVSLGSYLADRGHWPQIPEASEESTEAYESWWMAELEPYGGTDNVWKCPVLSAARVEDSSGYELKMHYVPADFDANPISPTRWPNMPWIIERGNNHGSGAIALFPDGSTRPFMTR